MLRVYEGLMTHIIEQLSPHVAKDEGLIVCDATGVIRIANETSRRFHGLPSGTLSIDPQKWSVALKWRDARNEPLPLEAIPLYRALRGEENVCYKVRIEGQPFEFQLSASPLRIAGELVGALQTLHDAGPVPVAWRTLKNNRERMVELPVWSWHTDLETLPIPCTNFAPVKSVARMADALVMGEEMVFLRRSDGLDFRFKYDGAKGLLIAAPVGTRLTMYRGVLDPLADILNSDFGPLDFFAHFDGHDVIIDDIYDPGDKFEYFGGKAAFNRPARFLNHDEVKTIVENLRDESSAIRMPRLFVRAPYSPRCLDFCDGPFIAKPVKERVHARLGRVIMKGEPRAAMKKAI